MKKNNCLRWTHSATSDRPRGLMGGTRMGDQSHSQVQVSHEGQGLCVMVWPLGCPPHGSAASGEGADPRRRRCHGRPVARVGDNRASRCCLPQYCPTSWHLIKFYVTIWRQQLYRHLLRLEIWSGIFSELVTTYGAFSWCVGAARYYDGYRELSDHLKISKTFSLYRTWSILLKSYF